MSDVKRYDAFHLRHVKTHIRYGEGCKFEVIAASDYDHLEQECERLREQVATLQSDANSWQSGYDKGRKDGDRHAREERNTLRAENQRLKSVIGESSARMVAGRASDAVLDGYLVAGIAATDASLDAALKQVETLREALSAVMTMDVNGHHLQDRLQFSPKGRAILGMVNAALQAKP